MQIQKGKKGIKEQGHVLLISLIITAIIGFLVISYLKLVKTQGAFAMRAQVWESVMPLVEAGIEEAMAHLNTMVNSNLAANGWTKDASNGFYRKRDMGEGFYYVRITYNNIEQPTITSSGYLPAPLTLASDRHAGPAFLASITGDPNVTVVTEPVTEPIKEFPQPPSIYPDPSVNYLKRTVQVTAQKQPFWAKGMVAKHNINLNGNNIASNSFDSSDPNFSGPGGAYDPTKTKDNGDIATNSGIYNPLNAGNAEIMGRVATGPGGGVEIGPSGSVGSKNWVLSGNNGIEPGYSADDMNVGFMDVQAPFTGGAFSPGGGIYNGTSYRYMLGTGNYQMTQLNMSGKENMIVTGHAKLYVTGDILMSGQTVIEIAPGASLELYVGGASATIAGNGLINHNNTADTFTYYGLPNNASLSVSGNGQFTGAIYAPNADFSMDGGGNNTIDFIGASVTRTVTMNGHFNFHYDEALGEFGPTTTYTIVSWNEM